MAPSVLVYPGLSTHPRETLPELFSQGQWRRLSQRLGLSRRQAQIAIRLTSDMSREEIAKELGVTAETVRTHMRCLFKKLEVRTRIGMVVMLVIHARPKSGETNDTLISGSQGAVKGRSGSYAAAAWRSVQA